MENLQIKLTLTLQEVHTLLALAANGSYRDVGNLIPKIQQQTQVQVDAANKPEPESFADLKARARSNGSDIDLHFTPPGRLMDYTEYKTQIATMAVVAEDDVNFLIILPQAIEYATLRMCRDIDFLSTVTANTSFSFTALNRSLVFPVSTFVTLQNVNVITPVGTSDPTLGTRNPLLPVTKEMLDFLWSSSTNAGVPSLFAMIDQNTIAVGPWPDANYSAELVGTIRPPMLSGSEPTTFISTYLPDLFVQASMIYVAEYQRNFGDAAGNDPQMGSFYENQYQTLLRSAVVEENRKKFASVGWTSMSPSPVATPSR